MIKLNARTRLAERGGKLQALSSAQSMSQGGGAGGHPMSRAMGGNASTRDSLLDGIVKLDPQVLRQIYMDMYLFDPTIGGGTDLLAMMPWSGYELSDATPDQLDVYYRSMEMMNYVDLMKEFTIDYLVLGAAVGTPVYSSQVKGFTDVIPHSIASIQIQEVPMYSSDPLLTLIVPDEMKEFANSKDPYINKLRQRLTPKMIDAFKSQEVTLDALTTMYVPRTSFSTVQTGMSMYNRIIPIYLLERLLYRGTLTEATRRQRSTLHIQAGDDLWNPDEGELDQLVQLFLQAEQDPVSAIVATQQNVLTQEIRAAGDFWKWTDNLEQFNDIKLRAMGINESFLSGDSTYDNQATAISVFMEQQDSLRELMVQRTLYTKLFPILSVTHGFSNEKGKGGKGRHRETAASQATKSLTDSFAFQVNDKHSLVIPRVVWHKKLQNIYSEASFDVLDKLAEKGIPVTLRSWAAAGGYDLDAAVKAGDEDNELRNRIAALKAKSPDLGTENDFDLSSDSELAMVRSGSHLLDRAMGGRGMKPLGLEGREFSEADMEVVRYDHSGKRKWVPDQHRARQEENARVMKTLKEVQDPHVRSRLVKKHARTAKTRPIRL